MMLYTMSSGTTLEASIAKSFWWVYGDMSIQFIDNGNKWMHVCGELCAACTMLSESFRCLLYQVPRLDMLHYAAL